MTGGTPTEVGQWYGVNDSEESAMQSHPISFIQQAEIRHTELQAEAAQFRLAKRAHAQRPTAPRLLTTAWRRCWMAIVNAAVRLQGAPTTARGDSPAVSIARADSLSQRIGVAP